ncbi:polysaccharide biosynthesis tyrosine autokinase [Cohnella luojiensis]|uniref:non-specific protein-tyrosine kinase n=1 Tax=Cohnella luojiensis TaxID=652876 RepID=A0A4Y8LPZ3_9BACL|nr:polysaccharide biosynthesis tyrosine autokinase [Cohnella luojiensis]
MLSAGKSKITILSKPTSIRSESYRTLRINIEFLAVDREMKTIVVTSSMRGEGKTATTLNLAIAYAQAGKKVLLIDADLRKPGVHLMFEGDNSCGLTNFLANQSTVSEAIQNTDIPNLFIITSGPIPPNPSELLNSQRIDTLLDEIKSDYDVVIIDTPPILGFIEAKMLAAKSSGVLLVLEHGMVKRTVAKRVKDELSSVKANLLGIVMNKMNKKGMAIYHR